ncbi:MAG: hypothetical protein IPK22_01110 [Verrucomicrobiaceae bacterium]|nr:hypothetical protein [Verrucomicrobiaceae bacterium]
MNSRFILCLVLLFGSPLVAQELPSADPLNAATSAAASALGVNDARLPGVGIAEGISEITGVAVSPLLGVSVIGAWTWWKTEADMRDKLPWYCQPVAWGIGLGLIALCLMKDILGAMVPAIAKKPLDWLELFENKASALMASTAFVPLVAIAMSQVDRIQRETASGVAMLPVASIADSAMHTPWFTVPVAVAAFLVVWLSSHAINVLIAFSPFGLVDTGLKLTKLGILAVVVGSATIHPWLGAAVALVLIAIGAMLAGWSLRLMIFGMLMGRDLILDRRADASEAKEGAKAFLARRTNGVPVRTRGVVVLDELGRPRFEWRSGFLGPKRSLPLEESRLVMCKGLVNPCLAQRLEGNTRPRSLLVLLPRYRGVEEALAAHLGCREVIDNALVRGFRAAKQWFADVFNSERLVVVNGRQ